MIADPTKADGSTAVLISRTAQLVRDFASYAGRRGITAVVFVTLGAFLESIGIVLLVPLIAVVLGTGSESGWLHATAGKLFALAGAETRFQRLALLLSIFVGLMIVRAVVLSTREVLLAQLQIGFTEAKRARLTRLLAAARWDAIAKLRHARIAHLMGSDIQSIGTTASFLLQCMVSLVVLITQCVVAFLLSPLLATLGLGLLAIGAFTLTRVMRQGRDYGFYLHEAGVSLTSSTTQFLSAVKLAVSQNLQNSFIAEFEDTLRNLTARRIAYLRQRTYARFASTTLWAIVAALAVLIGFGVMDIEPPVLVAVLILMARMNGPAMQIRQGAQQFATTLPTYERVMELSNELAAASSEASRARGTIEVPDGAIVFRNVGYSYARDDEQAAPAVILRNVDLTIEPGSFVGICGPSGAGKTTFADLLTGLLAPHSGEITIGGVPLRGAALNAWRNHVSYVSQDPFLFHNTVRSNLLWAAPNSSEEDLWSALRLVGADGLVGRMEKGLDTIVGERGTLLSGGERQRIALARAVLRHPRIIILDEATNAIDIAGEHEILSRLVALQPKPAIVMIAHRIESVSLCERVLSLEDGRFVETGLERARFMAAAPR